MSERKNPKQAVAVDSYVQILRQLKDNCTCPICQETYSPDGRKKPKLLPECCHSVCEDCADRLCRDVESVSPCCPLCRKQFRIPKGGAQTLRNNIDAVRSLAVISEVRRLSCRRHPGSTEDLCCVSCVALLCAKCYVDEHGKHEVTTVEVAAENFRPQLEKLYIETAAALDGHLTRAAVTLKDFADRASEVQQRVLDEEWARTKRVENDAAALLEQLAARLDPIRRKIDAGKKSLSEVVQRCQAIVGSPRELVRHFTAIRAEFEHLSQLTVDINVDDIERQQVDFTPLPLTDWIPVDSVNLVGRLTPSSSDDKNNPPTQRELGAQLDAARERESALRMELQATKEHQIVVSGRCSEQAMQHKQQEARMAERDGQLCRHIELLTAELVKLGQNERDLRGRIECEVLKNSELERKIAAQEECLAEASRKISELETRSEELRGQINAGELRRQDLEERLKTETKWRRNAEEESRERRHCNEDLMSLLEEERQKAERKYEELQVRATTLLINAKQQARQEVYSARENEIRLTSEGN